MSAPVGAPKLSGLEINGHLVATRLPNVFAPELRRVTGGLCGGVRVAVEIRSARTRL
jgi:hypothetical protein